MTGRRFLCLYLRPAIIGTVKTRLAQSLGDAETLLAYDRLVEHAITQLQPGPETHRCLWVAGSVEHQTVGAWASRWHAQRFAQRGRDLGQRMWQTFVQHAQTDPGGLTVIVGADCPTVDSETVARAFDALQDHEAVLAPAEDGGFGLIGLQHRQVALMTDPLSGIAWGTERVRAQTCAALKAAGCSVRELETVWDVDRLEDWHRFLATFGSAPRLGVQASRAISAPLASADGSRATARNARAGDGPSRSSP
jgi:rSAM/selenodomain-associated transferase 1